MQSERSLFAEGLISGLSVDLGYQVTYALPFNEGRAVGGASQVADIGGKDMSDYLRHIVQGKFGEAIDQHVVDAGKAHLLRTNVYRDYTERQFRDLWMCGYLRRHTQLDPTQTVISDDVIRLCYDFCQDLDDEVLTLPDGRMIMLSSRDRTRCVDSWFDPSLFPAVMSIGGGTLKQTNKAGEKGLAALCFDAISKCEGFEDTMCSNIVLSGGSAAIPGIAHGLERELKHKMGVKREGVLKVKRASNPQYAAWIGGSMLSSLSSFMEVWVTKDEYDEIGPSVAGRFSLNSNEDKQRKYG